MKIRLRLLKARPKIYVISDNRNVSLRIVGCSFLRIALKDDHHKKRTDMLAYTRIKYNYLETVAMAFNISARDRDSSSKKMLQLVRLLLQCMQTLHSVDYRLKIHSFWYQQFDPRLTSVLGGGQPVVDSDAADDCCLYFTTMRAMNVQGDMSSIPIDKFKSHYVPVFDLSAMQNVTEMCYYPEVFGELMRLELNFAFPLEYVTELSVFEERVSSIAVHYFDVVGESIQKRYCFSPAKKTILSRY